MKYGLKGGRPLRCEGLLRGGAELERFCADEPVYTAGPCHP